MTLRRTDPHSAKGAGPISRSSFFDLPQVPAQGEVPEAADRFAGVAAIEERPVLRGLPPPEREVTFQRGQLTWTDRFADFEKGTLHTRTWVAAEDRRARALLQGSPNRKILFHELRRALGMEPEAAAVKVPTRPAVSEPPPGWDTFLSETADDFLLQDPNTWAQGNAAFLQARSKSPDGKLLALWVGAHGGDESAFYLVNPTTQALLTQIPRCKQLLWLDDSSGFYYVAESADPKLPKEDLPGSAQLKFHKVGRAPALDPVLATLNGDSTRSLSIQRERDLLLMAQSRGWADSDIFMRAFSPQANGEPFRPLVGVGVGKQDRQTVFTAQNQLFVRTTEGASRGRIVQLDPAHPEAGFVRELVPEHPDATLDDVAIAGNSVVVTYLEHASQVLELRKMDGGAFPDGQKALRVRGLPALAHLQVGGVEDGKLSVSASSLNLPLQRYTVDLVHDVGEATRVGGLPLPPELEGVQVQRTFATSKDGTQVPVFLVHQEGMALDGTNPTVMEGYGGFGSAMKPSYRAELLPFLKRGGVYALVCLRGGGEYGEDWHQAGTGAQKQNVFDDFFASAEHLIAQGFTSPAHLAMRGASNGGLLMGAALTQRPELFRAAIVGVPLLDMLRYDTSDRGQAWISEYGTAANAQDARTLAAYSPYHQISPEKTYPGILLVSSDNDDRVSPWHAQKMAAALNAVPSKGPVLLSTRKRAGHSGSGQRQDFLEQQTNAWTFLFDQLGMNAQLAVEEKGSVI